MKNIKTTTVITLGKFTRIPGHSDPFTIFFVYSTIGNYVIKGMPKEVSDYLRNNFVQKRIPYFLRYTYWKDGVSRGGWLASSGIYIKDNRKDLHKRRGYTITIYKNNTPLRSTIMFLRRMPQHWISDFEI